MASLYLFCAVLGGGLVLFSLLGGSDGDAGIGDSLDADGAGGAGGFGAGQLLLGLFRVRNLTFLLAGFGVTGLLGTWAGLGGMATAVIAALMGVAAMVTVHAVFAWLRHTDSAVDVLSDADLEGTLARVELPLQPGTRGRVSCVASGRQIYLTARLAPDATQPLAPGAAVVILRMDAGVAEVAAASGLELPSSTD